MQPPASNRRGQRGPAPTPKSRLGGRFGRGQLGRHTEPFFLQIQPLPARRRGLPRPAKPWQKRAAAVRRTAATCHRNPCRAWRKIWTGIFPEEVRLLFRLLKAYFSLPREKRRIAADMVKSKLGLEGEAFRFAEDGLCCTHNCDFLADPRFIRAHSLGQATGSWGGSQILLAAPTPFAGAASWAAKLEEQFHRVRGQSGRQCAHDNLLYLRWNSRSGGGFPSRHLRRFPPSEPVAGRALAMVAKRYRYQPCLDEVTRTFAAFLRSRSYPGMLPDTLSKVRTERVAFLGIDMNASPRRKLQQPGTFGDKLVPGGIMVPGRLWIHHPFGQKQAFDRFAVERSAPGGIPFASHRARSWIFKAG